jgi:hypothetical protein
VFEIGTAGELASYNYFVNTQEGGGVFPAAITADIDLAGYEWAPMGWLSNYPNMSFYGRIFGNGHTISNLTINSGSENVGFLGWSTFAGVYDLNIAGASVTGGGFVGIMNGQAIGSFFENCHVEGEVNGQSAGAFLGHSTSTLINCTADVIVNGGKCEFLTYNDRAKSEIVIENPVVIIIDEEAMVTRPEVSGYMNLGWEVYHDGINVLSRNAQNEYSYTYFGSSMGTYEIYLSAFVSGQYVPISNTVRYEIDISGNLIVENAVPVQITSVAESSRYWSNLIENPLTITIDENREVTRPDTDRFDDLSWAIYRDGKVVLVRNAKNELSYKYPSISPGHYEIFLQSFINGGYVPVSNIVSYVIN